MLKLPSLLYLRSIRSKNSRVFSLSKAQWPISSIIRQEGRIRPLRQESVFPRSEEHTSELQSRFDLVCRLLLEKKNTAKVSDTIRHQAPTPLELSHTL